MAESQPKPIAASPPAAPGTTNRAKFETRNPVVRRLIESFYSALSSLVEPLDPGSVLDAGCGEGETIERLAGLLPDRVAAIDVEQACVDYVGFRLPRVECSRQSLYELDFASGAFDLVLCLEVLEHLERPDDAVQELARVTGKDLIVSVPYEPFFRIGSLLRGKYPRTLGNHPEHTNQFSPQKLRDLLSRHSHVLSVQVAFPWLLAHCRTA